MPTRYLPGAQPVDRPTPEELEKEKQMMSGEGAFFVTHRCFVCHSVSTLGIESAAKIGPDLSDAVADVQSRFGRTLEDFLANPTGTMSVVLATQIQLTDAEKREAVGKLKLAYQKKQATKRPNVTKAWRHGIDCQPIEILRDEYVEDRVSAPMWPFFLEKGEVMRQRRFNGSGCGWGAEFSCS